MKKMKLLSFNDIIFKIMKNINKTKLIACLNPQTLEKDFKYLSENVPDMVEYRADLVDDYEKIISQLKFVREKINVPVLFTLRDKKEGGIFSGNDNQRILIYNSVMPFVDAIDLETINAHCLEKLENISDKTIILSFHDFKKTPSILDLEKCIKKANEAKADIVKLAAFCKNEEDSERLLSLPGKFKNLKISVVGMGPFGKKVRKTAPKYGSVLGYASTTSAVAPGQLSVAELREAWQED